MDTSLLDEIHAYLYDNFTEQLRQELLGSLLLFDAFHHAKAYEPFPDILFDTSIDDREVVRTRMLDAFHEGLDLLLQSHQLSLVPEADIPVKNQILSVLYRLQHLEDPVPVLRILETDQSDEEQFAKIIAEYSVLDEQQVLEAVYSLATSTLHILRDYLYQQEINLTPEESPAAITERGLLVQNLKDFFHVHGSSNLANEMIQNGIAIGHAVKLYYPYIHEHLVTDDDPQTAKNLLSFFFIANDTFNDPLAVYRKTSDDLIHDHPRTIRIEALITQLLNDLRNYQKAAHDAQRLSVVQHPA